MATAVRFDASLLKKRRTEKVNTPKPSDKKKEKKVVPLTEEHRREISDFSDRFQTSGGFDVPKISRVLLHRVVTPIMPHNLEAGDTRDYVIKVANRAIGQYNKNRMKKKMEKDEVGDLVLVEVLGCGWLPDGVWSNYVTFKAKDSSCAVRTYETLMSSIFLSDTEERIEIFRVKPYISVEYPGHDKAEKPVVCG